MKITKILILLAFFSFLINVKISQAQVPNYIKQFINIDSIAQAIGMPVFVLKEVYIFPRENSKRQTRYNKMARNFMVVYPYALLIKEEFKEMEKNLAIIDNPRKQKAYIEMKDRELKKEYQKKFTKLTFSQSVMLVKLVDRETGNTSYELIKELKGSLTAFFWQNIALLFKNNLKMHYDAEGDDKEIEMLVKRYEAGTL